MRVKQRERMFAGKLPAWTGAAENRLGWVGEIRRRPIVLGSTAFAIAEKQRAIGRTEKPDQFPFYNNTTRVFDRSSVGSQGIGKCFIYFHPLPPDLLHISS
jgi:hypothetical protein